MRGREDELARDEGDPAGRGAVRDTREPGVRVEGSHLATDDLRAGGEVRARFRCGIGLGLVRGGDAGLRGSRRPALFHQSYALASAASSLSDRVIASA